MTRAPPARARLARGRDRANGPRRRAAPHHARSSSRPRRDAAGLAPAERRAIESGPVEADSVAVIARGWRMSGADRLELRLLALYPEQMNIYADRGNILFLQRRCEWRGIGFCYTAAGPGEGFDPGRARPDLHRRRPGPRPGAGRRGHAELASATRSRARRGRRRAARRLRRLPAARAQLPARRQLDPGARHRRPGDRPRGRAEADRQRRDRGDLGEGDGPAEVLAGVREPRRPHPPRRRRRSRSDACCTATATTAPTASRACAG